MQDLLIVVDMQNDFIDGALGTKEAQKIVPNVINKVKQFNGTILFTRDTHDENYLNTQEGKNLPIPHCIKDTHGWHIHPDLDLLRTRDALDKTSFGSSRLACILTEMNEKDPIQSITFIGLCTDICVIANAMVAKTFLPETKLIVDASCCAGVTKESHHTALCAMKACQIVIENE